MLSTKTQEAVKNKFISFLNEKGHKYKNKNKYVELSCPKCNHPEAFAYFSAGWYSPIICNRRDKCGWRSTIQKFMDYTISTHSLPPHIHEITGYTEEIKQYFANHGLDYKILIECGLLAEETPRIDFKLNGKNYHRYLQEDGKKGKLIWKLSSGFTSDITECYPVIHDQQKELYIMEGDSDLFKANSDGLPATSLLFGAGYTPQKNFWNLIASYQKILIVYDSDPSGFGQTKAGKIANLIKEKTEKQVGIIRLAFSEKDQSSYTGKKPKDYCDYRLNHSLEEFLKSPVTWVENNPVATDSLVPDKKQTNIQLYLSKIHPIFARYWMNFDGKTEAPKEYVIPSFLLALAAILGNKTYLKIGLGIRPNMYCILLGKSTFMCKTTGMDLGTIPFYNYSETKKTTYLIALDKYLEELENWQNMSKRERANKEKPLAPKDTSNIYANELTPEMLLKKMADKSDGIFMHSEIGSLLARLNAGYMNGFKEKLTEFFDGRAKVYRRETISGGCITIENAAPSLLAASTPEWIQKHLDDSDLKSGFLARFLIVNQTEYPPVGISLPPFYQIAKEWENLFQAMDKFDYALTLSQEATVLYSAWYDKFREWAIRQDTLLHSFLGRLRIVVHKIAIVNHVLDYLGQKTGMLPDIIQARSYELALPWVEFFTQNIISCYSVLTQTANINEERIKETVRRKGKQEGDRIIITQHGLCNAAHIKLKDLKETIELLEMKKSIQKIQKGKHVYYAIHADREQPRHVDTEQPRSEPAVEVSDG